MSTQADKKPARPAPARARAKKTAKTPAAVAPAPAAPAPKLGLRERKKRETRLAISAVATRLFIERGFERVTVGEVAEAAGVSVNTVFNYFATKEELFFDRGEELEAEPSRVVRERRPGESALDALERRTRRALQDEQGWPFGSRARAFLAAIEASPSLRARARVLFEESEARLAEVLREEAGAKPEDPTPRLVAALITALEWRLVQEFHARMLRGDPDAEVRAALAKLAARGVALLRAGVGDYARKK